ncbi:MAG TPA: aminotransferase class IV [Terriglobia bacterium]|nr:aminotransferase class IV [Terriglobia bacterium]
MIHRFVFHNDRLLPIHEVRLSPGQSGLLSGWGLFTTMQVIEGIPFAFERHWLRLSRNAERIRCPFPFEAGAVRDRVLQVLLANEVKEGSARIYVINNQPGPWRSDENLPAADLLIYSGDLPVYQEPVRLSIREHGRHAASPLAGVKVTSWLNNVWNLNEAHEAGYDEVILLNERGEVAECTTANIFCVFGGRIFTPPLSSGCLEGVTRSIVLEIAPQAGIRVEERTLFSEDLYAADEVFISSTNRSVIAVGEIAARKMPAAPGPVMRNLEGVFASYVRQYVEKYTAASAPR